MQKIDTKVNRPLWKAFEQ